MFPLAFLDLFNSRSGGVGAVQIALFALIGLGVYFLVQRFKGESVVAAATKLPERSGKFLQHVNSLGVPFMAQLLKDVASRNYVAVAADVEKIFDSFDDDDTRHVILDRVFDAQLEWQLSDPERKAKLLKRLAELGVTPALPAPTPTP